MEALLLEEHTPFLGAVVRPFLERERIAELADVQKGIVQLAMAAQAEKDGAKRAEILRRVEQLQEREGRLLGGGQP